MKVRLHIYTTLNILLLQNMFSIVNKVHSQPVINQSMACQRQSNIQCNRHTNVSSNDYTKVQRRSNNTYTNDVSYDNRVSLAKHYILIRYIIYTHLFTDNKIMHLTK